MAINPLSIPYPDFRFDEIINPEAFDLNNDAIKGKVNELVTIANNSEITSGSTSNGSYVKYPDGTMIAYNTVGGVAGTGLKTIATITYPVAFTAIPSVQVTHRSIAGKFANYYVLDPQINKFSLVHQGVNNVDLGDTIFTWTAIGKWK